MRLIEFDYDIICRSRRMPSTLSRFLIPQKDENEEVDDEIPTFQGEILSIDTDLSQLK